MTVPILNGGPFFYFDTSSYIEQAAKVIRVIFPTSPLTNLPTGVAQGAQTFGAPEEDKVVFGGRSLFYGAFAYTGWSTTIWLPVVVQALTLSWLVIMLFDQLSTPMWEVKALLAITLVAFLSSASLFAGLIMPDIWAGFMVLALALLWAFGPRLSPRVKFALFLIVAFAVLSHNSHFVLLAAMILFLGLLRLIRPFQFQTSRGQFTIPVLALAVGIVGQLAYSSSVRAIYGAHLLQRPFFTAHLTDLGPGTRLMQESCPESEFALCAYADRLPVDWITFLFDAHPDVGVFAAASPSVQKALVAEQGSFALATLMAEPRAMIVGLAMDGIAQLWTLSIDDVALSHQNDTYIAANFPDDLIDRLENTYVYNYPDVKGVLLRIIQTTSLISMGFLIVWVGHRMATGATNNDDTRALDRVVLFLIAGLIFNALICGVLASPYGRFQARVIWILPLVATLIFTTGPNWPRFRRIRSAS